MNTLMLIAAFACNGVDIKIYEEQDQDGTYWRTNMPGIMMPYERTHSHDVEGKDMEQLREQVVQVYRVTRLCPTR